MKFVSVDAAALLALSNVTGATELRLSHQWSNKNFSPKVTEIVAKEVAAANVDLVAVLLKIVPPFGLDDN
jgi:hypothetical protein